MTYEQPKSRAATISDANSINKRTLFKFARSVTQSGAVAKVLREFTCPDSEVTAREHIGCDGHNLVSHELEELQINARDNLRGWRDQKALGKGI